MEVRVVFAQPYASRPETDYVCVHTFADPADDTVTLATIERVVEKTKIEHDDDTSATKRVKTLVMRRPMSPDEALVFATSYAERKGIPVVYTEEPEL